MALVFDKALDAVPGRVDQIAPSIRRVLAPNPGAFTYLGTGTYIVGSGTVAIIDPGPDNVAHLEALARALEGETVSHIVCTHTHPDHSPGSRRLKAMVGGAIVGCAPHPVDIAVEAALAAQLRASTQDDQPATEQSDQSDQSESEQSESEHAEERSDADHVPEWLMVDGDTIDGPGWTLEAVATPGHISNHLCFAFSQADVLFSGDHVMAWSTSVVSPPAGDLNDYLRSLEKVRARAESTYWPTHGPAVRDPHTYVSQLHGHRLHRTAQVLEQLNSGEKTIAAFVAAMYPGLDERLIKAAGRSVLAHLVALRQEGRVLSTNDADDATTQYSLGF